MKGLIPWRRTTGLLEPFRHEMEELFDRFFGPEDGGNGATAWAPRVDVEETDKEILVKADLPGVDPKDVEIAVSDGALVVKGERKEAKEERRKNSHRVERFVGQFYREIPLPAGADEDRITATSAKGVITVTVPKKPGAQPKKIAVKEAQ
jgi:HSP20 family protein